jgi:hypothetical protein
MEPPRLNTLGNKEIKTVDILKIRSKIFNIIKYTPLLAVLASCSEDVGANDSYSDNVYMTEDNSIMIQDRSSEISKKVIPMENTDFYSSSSNRGFTIVVPPEACVLDSMGLSEEIENIKQFILDELGRKLPRNLQINVISYFSNPRQSGNHHMESDGKERFHYIDVLTTDDLSILKYRLMHEFIHAVLRESMPVELLRTGGIDDEEGICEFIAFNYIEKQSPEGLDEVTEIIQLSPTADVFNRVKSSGKSLKQLMKY